MPSSQQTLMLMQAPAAASIKKQGKFDYISHQAVRLNLIRTFGYGGFDFELLDVTLLKEESKPAKTGSNWHVIYRVHGRLTVRFDDGRVAHYTEVSVDKSQHPELEQAHDNAVKGAASMCLRRCSINLGSLFGLGLYFNSHGDVVSWTLESRIAAEEEAE